MSIDERRFSRDFKLEAVRRMQAGETTDTRRPDPSFGSRRPVRLRRMVAYDIQPSMSRVGNPYDNAKAESFMKTLKQGEINGSRYRNLCQARSAIGAFIETAPFGSRLPLA